MTRALAAPRDRGFTSLRGAIATKQSSFSAAKRKLDCFASLAMTMRHSFAISQHVFCSRFALWSGSLRKEGAGNTGRAVRPQAACAMVVTERTRVGRSHRNHPAFPTQWFTGYCALSPVRRAFWPPSPARLHADLTPASGCQDHTPSPSAGKRPRQKRLLRPPHPAPRL